jgi:hypothetical protein
MKIPRLAWRINPGSRLGRTVLVICGLLLSGVAIGNMVYPHDFYPASDVRACQQFWVLLGIPFVVAGLWLAYAGLRGPPDQRKG